MKNLYKSQTRVAELKLTVDEILRFDKKITSVEGAMLRDRTSFSRGSILRT